MRCEECGSEPRDKARGWRPYVAKDWRDDGGPHMSGIKEQRWAQAEIERAHELHSAGFRIQQVASLEERPVRRHPAVAVPSRTFG